MSAHKRNWAAAAATAVGTVLIVASLGPVASAQTGSAGAAKSVGSVRSVIVDRLSLRLAADPNQVANVRGGGSADGTPVIQYPWSGAANERWDATAVGGGYYRFASWDGGKCLNVRGGGTENFAPVIQYTCGNFDNELWKFVPKGIGYQIVVKSSDKCLNVQGGVGQGNPLIQYSCTPNGAPNDVWLPVWEPVS